MPVIIDSEGICLCTEAGKICMTGQLMTSCKLILRLSRKDNHNDNIAKIVFHTDYSRLCVYQSIGRRFIINKIPWIFVSYFKKNFSYIRWHKIYLLQNPPLSYWPCRSYQCSCFLHGNTPMLEMAASKFQRSHFLQVWPIWGGPIMHHHMSSCCQNIHLSQPSPFHCNKIWRALWKEMPLLWCVYSP